MVPPMPCSASPQNSIAGTPSRAIAGAELPSCSTFSFRWRSATSAVARSCAEARAAHTGVRESGSRSHGERPLPSAAVEAAKSGA